MRKYQKLWNTIRDNSTATVEAPVDMHNRLIEAVRKEKKLDKAYKYLALEAGIRPKLMHKIEGTKITFYIVGSLTHNVISL